MSSAQRVPVILNETSQVHAKGGGEQNGGDEGRGGFVTATIKSFGRLVFWAQSLHTRMPMSSKAVNKIAGLAIAVSLSRGLF